jgi:hypothetical protein
MMADLFASISDNAVNRIIDFAHVRAPYLFNYVAPTIALSTDANGQLTGIQEVWLTCLPVADPPDPVPKYWRVPPFGLPGVPVRLPYSVQLADLKLDFHPSDAIALPPELAPPLAAQRFALAAKVQFGFPCVPADAVSNPIFGFVLGRSRPVSVLPVTALQCFEITIAATGHLVVKVVQPLGAPTPLDEIHLEVDGVELVDIAPAGLENAVECYLVAMLKGFVLPQLVLQFQQLAVNALGIGSVTPRLTPGMAANPAIEQNELRISIDVSF